MWIAEYRSDVLTHFRRHSSGLIWSVMKVGMEGGKCGKR